MTAAAGLLRIPLPAGPSLSFCESVEGAHVTGIPLTGLGQAEEQEPWVTAQIFSGLEVSEPVL